MMSRMREWVGLDVKVAVEGERRRTGTIVEYVTMENILKLKHAIINLGAIQKENIKAIRSDYNAGGLPR